MQSVSHTRTCKRPGYTTERPGHMHEQTIDHTYPRTTGRADTCTNVQRRGRTYVLTYTHPNKHPLDHMNERAAMRDSHTYKHPSEHPRRHSSELPNDHTNVSPDTHAGRASAY